MKIALFQALIAGLLFFTAPVFNAKSSAQYNNPQPGYSPQNYQANNYQGQPRIPRYPLSQGNGGFTPAPGYAPANQNTIQQPQYYSGNGNVQSQPVPRVFSPGSFAYPNQGVPQVANNYGYQQQAPKQDPTSPSNLPIPGNNLNNGNTEQLNPGNVVQPLASPGIHPATQHPTTQHPATQHPTVQHPMGTLQGAPHSQHFQPQPQNGGGMVQPYVGNLGCVYPQAGVTNMAPAGSVYGNSYAGNVYGPAGGYNSGLGGGFGGGFGRGFGGGFGSAIVAPARVNPSAWFGSLGSLVFNRDYEDDHVYAYPFGLPLTNSLVTTDADVGAMGGLEASFGRRFCNGAGFEVVYWGLFSEDGIATASGGNPQTNWQTANYIDYNVSTMDVYLNAALAYRLRRTNEFHNIELNFFRRTFTGNGCGGGFGVGGGAGYGVGAGMGGGGGGGGGWGGRPAFGANCGQGNGSYPMAGGAGNCGGGCGNASCGGGCNVAGCGNGGCGNGGCGVGGLGLRSRAAGAFGACGCGPRIRARRPFRFDVLAGVRFFRFDENLFFQASTTGDYVPNVNDMNYDIDVTNNMVGVQIGGNVEYALFPRMTLVGGTRLGIYGNSISQTQQIYGLAGYGSPNVGPWAGQDYNHRSTKTDVAFLGQLDLGLRYAMNCRWGLGFGYRILSISGVALAPEQIPYDFSDYQEVNYINSNGGLILHGAYLRAQYNY